MTLYLDIEHRGLGKFRRIRGSDSYVVRRKADEQEQAWRAQWERKQEINAGRNHRLATTRDRDGKKALALRRTQEAQTEIDELRSILARTMSLEKASWTSLFDRSKFSELPPRKPELITYPVEPKLEDVEFRPNLSLFCKIFPPLKRRHIKHASERWAAANDQWKSMARAVARQNEERVST